MTEYLKDYSDKDEINVLNIIEIIGRMPFDLKNPKEIALLARFLIEDNTDESHAFSLHNSNHVEVVCSILKCALGNYEVFLEEKNKKIRDRLKSVSQPDLDCPAEPGQAY